MPVALLRERVRRFEVPERQAARTRHALVRGDGEALVVLRGHGAHRPTQAEHGVAYLVAEQARVRLLARYQFEEGAYVVVRDAVDAVDKHLRQVREQLDERDAGVGGVVVRPLRRVRGDERARLFHEVGVASVVEVRQTERHTNRFLQNGGELATADTAGTEIKN